ncbi:MAG: GDSL-type esterase/lipase family protein, partial [Rhodanobacter sp.]
RPQAVLLVALSLVAMWGGNVAAAAGAQEWVTSWGRSMTSNHIQVKGAHGEPETDAYGHPVDRSPDIHAATLRQTVFSTVGGDRVRIHLSNYYGLEPLTVSAAGIALGDPQAKDLSTIQPASAHPVTFEGGHASVTIAPGQAVVSDPVSMHVPRLSRVAVSLYFSGTAHLSDVHPFEPERATYAVPGSALEALSLAGKTSVLPKDDEGYFYFLDGLQVLAPASTRGIVAFGDSITDGHRATGPGKPWPAVLARIADEAHGGAMAAVVNAGIGGNELTTDQIGNPGAGASGLKRFEHDVIEQPGVTDVIVLFGANDLERGIDPAGYPRGASANDMIASLRMLIDVAHQHHLRIYAGTITPVAGFPDPGWYTPRKEAIRQQVNQWIRTSGAFDGVIPFAEAISGTYKPSPLAATQHPLPPGMANICAGDAGLHPNDRGYEVMGTLAYNALFGKDVQPRQPCH